MALESSQPLIHMSARYLPGDKERTARNVDNPTVICEPIIENVGAWTSHTSTGLQALLLG
jgi:hypothetical protein